MKNVIKSLGFVILLTFSTQLFAKVIVEIVNKNEKIAVLKIDEKIEYEEELVSEEYPEICPFCGEQIEDITESEYIEDDDSIDEDDEWTN